MSELSTPPPPPPTRFRLAGRVKKGKRGRGGGEISRLGRRGGGEKKEEPLLVVQDPQNIVLLLPVDIPVIGSKGTYIHTAHLGIFQGSRTY